MPSPARLETRDGQLVGTAMIPAFPLAPGVLFWGARVFVFSVATDGVRVYREVFAFQVVRLEPKAEVANG